MSNRIGKGLVLVHTAFALLLMAWAGSIFLSFDDFGWKDPFKVWDSKDTGKRVASQLDKRVAALHQLYHARDRAVPGIRPAVDALMETMEHFPKNHLFYTEELKKIREAPDAIAPKAIVWDKGDLVLDTKDKLVGKVTFGAPVPGIDKSIKTVNAELADVLAKVEAITPVIAKLVKDIDEITIQLYGSKNKDGTTDVIGLLEVLENEKTHQDKIAAEKTHLIPIYVDAQRRTENYLERFRGMTKTLTSFQKKS